MILTSPVFEPGGPIPQKYTCEGLNMNPPLTVHGIHKDAKSLVLIVDDPDAPHGTFDHWIVWNIPVKNEIKENTAPGTEGKNGFGENRYMGPCPPTGTHRYFFKVYALDVFLEDLKAGANKQQVEDAMKNHTLASADLIGLYKKGSKKLQ